MPLCGSATSIVTQRRMDGAESGEAGSLARPQAPNERLEGVVQAPQHATAGPNRKLSQAVLVGCTQLRQPLALVVEAERLLVFQVSRLAALQGLVVEPVQTA